MPIIKPAQIPAFFGDLAPTLWRAINLILVDFVSVQAVHELVHRGTMPIIELQPDPVMARNPADIAPTILPRGKLIIGGLGTTLPIVRSVRRLRLSLRQIALRQLHQIESLGHVWRSDNPIRNRTVQ